jgi:hypothetical protein
MADSNVNEVFKGNRVSDEEFAEAEQLARRALEQNKDDEEARKLWKMSRRAQGKSLGSDLPEMFRKEIYAEYALAVDKLLYLTSEFQTRLQQAGNPHDMVNTSIANASAEARNSIVSKYAITPFELDLILHEGEKESWPFDDE